MARSLNMFRVKFNQYLGLNIYFFEKSFDTYAIKVLFLMTQYILTTSSPSNLKTKFLLLYANKMKQLLKLSQIEPEKIAILCEIRFSI